MFNRQDPRRNACMLTGSFSRQGYDWWWHSFTAQDEATGDEKPFFVEFYVCNPALAKGNQPVFADGTQKPSYLMIKAGCWGEPKLQLHRYFAWQDVELHADAPYSVTAGDCFASDKTLRGSVCVTGEEAAAHPEWRSDAGSMTWDLTLDKCTAFNVGYGACGLLRALKAFEMYWHAEGMKTLVSGTVTLNGRRFVVRSETSFGYSDKNWGRDFTSPWVWLASSCMTSRITGQRLTDSVFDIGGGRPKVFGVALERQLLSAFWYEGTPYEFNFSKFWTGTRTEFESSETDDEVLWHVRQENRRAVMDTDVRCRKQDMLLIRYVAPNGQARHNRLWNGGNGIGRVRLYRKDHGQLALIDDLDVTHIGCEYGEYGK